MSFQTPITVAEALRRVRDREYVLPAIQREFVWSRDRIVRLFDSLMRGYPIGSFLMWQVEADNAGKFVFYDVMREYHERDNAHCAPTGSLDGRRVTAVLDGQQRLTALNIGLRGAHTQKLPRLWANNPAAYPKTELYLDLLHQGGDDDLGLEYDFRFLTATDVAGGKVKPGAVWFKVEDILQLPDVRSLFGELQRLGLGNDPVAASVLPQLQAVVHTNPTISFFREESQALDKVLNIFIRVNSGGMVLSYSDLLLSVATAEWKGRDARETIHSLVDELNAIGSGFAFTKDLVLKTGLVLLDRGDIKFKVDNFDRDTLAELDKRWDEIEKALRTGARLLADFGFSQATLTAHSVLIPIAYYLHTRRVPDNYLTSGVFQADREAVRRWSQRTLLKSGVWGSGLDRLLTGLRAVIQREGAGGWPAEAIESEMARQGKSLRFEATEIDDLLDSKYGAKRIFPLLAMLYPGIDTREQFHEDHVFPRALLRSRARLRKGGVTDADLDQFQELCDRVPNLQLLRGHENSGKRDKMPAVWLAGAFPTIEQRESWLRDNDATGLPDDIPGFPVFFAERRARMRTRLVQLLATVAADNERPLEAGDVAVDEPDPGNEGL